MKHLVWSRWAMVFVTALLTSGCGKPSSKASSVNLNSNNTGCSTPLTVGLSILSPTGVINPGTTVTMRVTASMCPGTSFQIQGRPIDERFSSNFDYLRTFATGGSFEESVSVNAYDSASSTLPRANAIAKFTVNVATPPGNPPPPNNTPVACAIERVPAKYVTQVNQPMSIILRATGPYVTTTINGIPVVPNVEFFLPPSVRDSGNYVALGEVSSTNQKVACPFAAYTPVCQHRVNSAFVMGAPEKIKLETSTSIMGPVFSVVVNGETVNNLPVPLVTEVAFTNQIPYSSRGPLGSSALVVSPAGDSVACGAEYYANFSLAINSLNPRNYFYAFGFNEIMPGNRSLTGLGAGPQGTSTWTYRPAEYSVPILEEGPSIPRVGICGVNEVMVGRQPWPDPSTGLSLIACARVRPELAVRNVYPRPMVWNYNTYEQCFPGTTLVGSIFTPGGAGLGTLTLMCGELYQLPNQ